MLESLRFLSTPFAKRPVLFEGLSEIGTIATPFVDQLC